MIQKRISRPCKYCGISFRKQSRRDYVCDKCEYLNKVKALKKSAGKRKNIYYQKLKKLRVR